MNHPRAGSAGTRTHRKCLAPHPCLSCGGAGRASPCPGRPIGARWEQHREHRLAELPPRGRASHPACRFLNVAFVLLLMSQSQQKMSKARLPSPQALQEGWPWGPVSTPRFPNQLCEPLSSKVTSCPHSSAGKWTCAESGPVAADRGQGACLFPPVPTSSVKEGLPFPAQQGHGRP